MKTVVLFLWHMHQPDYRDASSGQYALPWTRLHAVKDYDEMANVLEACPGVRNTVNLTPVLAEQIAAHGRGVKDVYWLLSEKPAKSLELWEREFLFTHFFKANFDTMVKPYERYAELYFMRGGRTNLAKVHEAARAASDQDLRDLQVWMNLAWMSERYKREDELTRELVEKGQSFTEKEKLGLLKKHQEICAGVLEKYGKLARSGVIEISTTPYFHPILPLLLDFRDARISRPDVALPDIGSPELFSADARRQVRDGLAFAETIMGFRPSGMWPSEGSISEKTCALLASEGVRWAATDEGILRESLALSGISAPEPVHGRPYLYETDNGPLTLFFRDLGLSDRIGFIYSNWNVTHAVDDLVGHLERMAGSVENLPCIPVILDGENAWEFFPDGTCRVFLETLFARLADHPTLETRTYGDAAKTLEPGRLTRIKPGSWINKNFDIWVGHEEDNTAWEYLSRAKRVAEESTFSAETAPLVDRCLLTAEGSDWYWWYGDDHSSEDDQIFDRLFRENLIAIYRYAAQPVPEEFYQPIKKVRPVTATKLPTGFFTPELDGLDRPFYEWLSAGLMEFGQLAGAMHKAVFYLDRMLWGFDKQKMYLRFDPSLLFLSELERGRDIRIKISFAHPAKRDIELRLLRGFAAALAGNPPLPVAGAFSKVIEVGIPLETLDLELGKRFGISVSLTDRGDEIERWPAGSVFEFTVPDERYVSEIWYV